MERQLYNFTRGELGRRVYEKETEFHSIREPISQLMERVEGAELVSQQWMKIGDMHQITYFISPEGVCLHFDASTNVRVNGFASNDQIMDKVYEKMQRALAPGSYAKKVQADRALECAIAREKREF